MKAFRLYGSSAHPDLSLDEVPLPAPARGEILVRVHATAVTTGELVWSPTWQTSQGEPRMHAVPGHEFSGVIAQIGPDVAEFKKGDAVYGLNSWFNDGATAEYCLTTPAEIALKPATIDHPKAAAVPISGLTAWQALFEHGNLKSGQKVLIHGGAGGVGTFAIQLAVWKGVSVATTVSEANFDFVRQLGATEVINYRKGTFDEIAKQADLILDLVGGDTLHRSFEAVKEGGKVVTIAASSESTDSPKVKEAFFIVEANRAQLEELAQLIDKGIIRSITSDVLPFSDAALAYFPRKKSGPGKTVLQVVA